MCRLNPNTPKHNDFIDINKYVCHVPIDCQNFTQKLREKFKEATQYRIVESIGAQDLFQFLVNTNNPGNAKKMKTCCDF